LSNDKEVFVFFPTLIATPILAGLVAGVFTGRRLVPWLISAGCVALGTAGAVVMAFNPDNRGQNMTFGLIAGISCAALVWGGFAAARIGRGSLSQA
jgi:mannitol-specific phosphotransferase system IIBC component